MELHRELPVGGATTRRAIGGTALAALALVGALAATELVLRALGLGHPILYDNRAAYGYRPLPGQAHRRLRGAHVRVNALGLRGPEVADPKPAGVRRVLFLGDSVTFGGTYVDDDAIFPAVAGRRLVATTGGRVEALDGGVNAWGPENVLGLVGPDGAFPDGFGSDAWVLTLLDDDFGRQMTRIGEVPYMNVAPRTAIEELLVVAAYRLLGSYKRPRPAGDLAAAAARNLDTIETLLRHAAGRGVPVLLVWHPSVSALVGKDEPAKPRLADLAARTGAPFLDLAPRYAAHGGPRLFADGIHLNAAGHAVAGEAIGDRLADILSPR